MKHADIRKFSWPSRSFRPDVWQLPGLVALWSNFSVCALAPNITRRLMQLAATGLVFTLSSRVALHAIDVDVTAGVVGSTPKVVGYGIAHYLPGGNTQSWWDYSGANGARIWSSPPIVEPADDLSPWGDGVTNQAQFIARRTALRTSPLGPVFIDWSDFEDAYANTTTTGSNKMKLEYAAQSLTEIDNDLLVVMQRRVGSYDWPSNPTSNSTADWNNRWEAWQHWYAQAFYYAKNFDTERFQIYNEPDHPNADPLSQTQWLEMSQFAANAVESAIADVNTIYGKSLSPRMHAAGTAGGPDLNPGGYGELAIDNLHRPLFSTADVSGYDLFKTFDYHQYTTFASGFADNIVATTDALNTATGNQASNYGVAISEFNVYTNGSWPASLTPDSLSVYRDLGEMVARATNVSVNESPKELYLFKFGSTGNANFAHYLDNEDEPHNVGGVTKLGQVYHLFAKGFADKQLLDMPSTASGTFWTIASQDETTGDRFFYSTHGGTGTSLKTLDIDLTPWGVAPGTRVIVEQVSENYHGEVSQVLEVPVNQEISVIQEPGSTVLVSIPGAGNLTYTDLLATDDAHVKSGSNSGTNYGTSTNVWAKNDAVNANARNVGFIQFDLGSIESKDVDQALLRVFGENTGSNDTVIAHVYGILDDSWDEDTITWDSAPNLAGGLGVVDDISHNFIEEIGTSAAILGHFTANSDGRELILDVTDFVQDHPDSKISFLIAREVRFDGENVDDAFSALMLASKERVDDIGPQLMLALLPPTSAADFNLDGSVDEADLALLQAGYGITAGAVRSNGDANGDGSVDGADFLRWQQEWNGAASAINNNLEAIPEPSALILLVSSLLLVAPRFSCIPRLV